MPSREATATKPAELRIRNLSRSHELLERAREVIPGASQTMSKGPTQWVQGVAPNFLRRAQGCRVWDVDGNEYLDFPMALGPMILGHGHPAVLEAITAQLADGITFTLPHPLEVEVAERIVAAVPGVERVRFAKTGSEATSAAVRVARALTGRERVIVAGYHGWHDWYIGATSLRLGVPRSTSALVDAVAAGDLDTMRAVLERHRGAVAAVMIEPAGVHEPSADELHELIDLVHEHGSLVIFDEIVTGFRLSLGGAQEHYGVRADLTCLGKALGSGTPISALAGPAKYMDVLDRVFFSGTHGGEALSLAAAAATLDVIREQRVTEHLWRQGRALQDGVNRAIARHGLEGWVDCGGPAPVTIITPREPLAAEHLPVKTLLQQELLRRGVLYNGSHLISLAHRDEDIAEAIDAFDGAFGALARALPDRIDEHLEGPPVARVFRAF